MSELLEDMIALEDAARRCIPRLTSDPVIRKCEFQIAAFTLVDVEYHNLTGHKVVVIESCGELSYYIAEVLRELLSEDGIDAWVTFKH
jgi:hypothetical protein